jgi:uncharacterized membrane protein YraQ (UPF0718 family)
VVNVVNDFVTIFSGILYEALPFIVLGAVIAGLVEELVPQSLVVKFIPKNRFLAIAMGGWLGLIFPMCECGILTVMRRLLRKGVPLSTCVCYMLGGPIINVVVMLSTYVAFAGMDRAGSGAPGSHQIGGWGMMGLRVGMGFLVAFGTALIVEWQYSIHGDALLAPKARPPAKPELSLDDADQVIVRKPWAQRIGNIADVALHDFVDVAVLLIIGDLLASLCRVLVPQTEIEELSRNMPVLAIGLMMGLAVLLCLCSEADAFVAASFVALRPASKLAFLVLGPMLDFKLYMMYLQVFRPRLIWTIISCVVVQVFGYSILLHYIWENYSTYLVASAAP